MKKIVIILSATIFAASAAFAQPQRTLEGQPVADRSLNIYRPYQNESNGLPQAPKGYKPCYITHYGRHGSRYLLNNNNYLLLHNCLSTAHRRGALTAAGEQLFADFEKLYPQLRGHGGELSPLGIEQHHGIAERMVQNYPNLFKGKNCKVTASSTEYERTLASMTAFLDELRAQNPQIKTDWNASNANFYINPHVVSNPDFTSYEEMWRSPKGPWRDINNAYFNEKVDHKAIAGRIFTSEKEAKIACGDVEEFIKFLYFHSCDMVNIPVEQINFAHVFTQKEFLALSDWDNYYFYLLKGRTPMSQGRSWALGEPILKDFVDNVESDIAKGTSARLRFGHDGCIALLMSMLKWEGWGIETDDVEKINATWHCSDIAMACNIQWVFYSNKAGDLLVRVLFNEKDMYLPMRPAFGSFYHWSDLKEYCQAKIAEAHGIVQTTNGLNLYGYVRTTDGKPMAGVQVSDGVSIVKTNKYGYYEMKSAEADSTVFITTPSGFVAEGLDAIRPGIWQRLDGNPETCERHDFKLKAEDQTGYRAVFITDIHLYDTAGFEMKSRFEKYVLPTANKLARGASGPVYTMNLGDFSHDLYWYDTNMTIGQAYDYFKGLWPMRMYSVSGNHDNDGAEIRPVVDDRAAWYYRRVFGPAQYSVNIGGDHWIFLDDIIYHNVAGKGKKAKNIKGDRTYKDGLTDAQKAWIVKDLAEVSSDTPVYICLHCPALRTPVKGYLSIPAEDVQLLEDIAGRFSTRFTLFSGHIHQFEITDHKDYPHLFQYSLPASSGVMWETIVDAPLVSGDGSDGGLWWGDFKKGSQPDYHFESYCFGEKYMRVYDMNEVGKAYKANATCRKQHEMFPTTRKDYSQPEYKNCVYVNYYSHRPGDTVEMWENGKQLEVKHTRNEDPVHNFAMDLRIIEQPGFMLHQPKPKRPCNHMYTAKAATAKADVIVIVKDSEGKEIHREVLKRPKAFSVYMK